MSDQTPENVTNVEDMSIEQLRQYASFMNLRMDRSAKKQDYIDAIKNKSKNRDVVIVGEQGTRPAPGYARIELLRNGASEGIGASQRPVWVGVNGYNVTIPLGVDVDVPIKVLRALESARTSKYIKDEYATGDQPRFKLVESPSYPFAVKDINPGPDPRPIGEDTRRVGYGLRKAFRDMFGRWPRGNAELDEAQKQGFIKMTTLEQEKQLLSE